MSTLSLKRTDERERMKKVLWMIRIDSWFQLRSRALEEMLLPFLFSGIWALLMVVLQKFYKNDLEYNSCINSFIHTFAVCRGCELVWYIEESMKLDQFGDDLSMPQYLVVSLSLGYFIYDFIICFLIQENIVFIIHHFICIASLASGVFSFKGGPETIFTLWCCELTGPFLNIRYFLERSKCKSSLVAITNECIFAILFIIFRYGFLAWITYKTWLSPNCLLSFKLLSIVFILLNQFICYIMFVRAKHVLYHVFSRSTEKAKHEF